MKLNNKWLVALLSAFVLAACSPVDNDSDEETETTNESEVEVTEEEIDSSTGSIGSSAGQPDVDSFSLSVEGAVVENAYSVDGVTLAVNVHVGDRFNHPVDDGTIVSFWTEYGYITDSCQTTGGACSVTWTSSGKRPADGLSTVIAYTLGEDSFIEENLRNGIYNVDSDSVDLFSDEAILSTPELYFDRNFDGYTSTGFTDLGSGLALDSDAYVDLDSDGQFDSSSSKFRGVDCSAGAVSEGHCAQSQIHVWSNTQIALSRSFDAPQITVEAGPWNRDTYYNVTVSDSFGNYPPAGTSITVSSDADDFEASYGNGEAVPVVGLATQDPHTFTVAVSDSAGGTAKIEIEYKGSVYTYYVTYN